MSTTTGERFTIGEIQVGEPVLVQPLEHPPEHLLPRDPQEGADQRRPQRPVVARLSKVT